MAEGFQLLQGPSDTPMTPAQCKLADVDLLVSFWLVRLELRCSEKTTGHDGGQLYLPSRHVERARCHGTPCGKGDEGPLASVGERSGLRRMRKNPCVCCRATGTCNRACCGWAPTSKAAPRTPTSRS